MPSAKGIYNNGVGDPTLRDTVLVTAANSGFSDFYKNWALKSQRLGLKWVLVALDQDIFDSEEESRVILSDNYQNINKAASSFREPDYNILVCSKLRIVASIVLSAGVNVVFSDVDNVCSSMIHLRMALHSPRVSGRVDMTISTNTTIKFKAIGCLLQLKVAILDSTTYAHAHTSSTCCLHYI